MTVLALRVIAAGRDADVALVDTCRGGSQHDALSALRNGDIMGVGAVITDGTPRFVGRSRNAPENDSKSEGRALPHPAKFFR